MSFPVGVVADDLTGANDAAVQFASVGWRTLIALGQPSGPGAPHAIDVVAVTTDSRAATASGARADTDRAVRGMAAAGAERLYLKVDSTMRGSIAAQIQGAVEAWSQHLPGAFALLCPSYPALGRTVAQGKVRMNGAPLETRAPGQDPVTPVRTSVLTELVPGAVHVESAGLTVDELARRICAAAGERAVVAVDAVTDEDLDLVAEAVTLIGTHVVPTGSAGLASAIARRWRRGQDSLPTAKQVNTTRRSPTLVLVTSMNETTRTQQQHLTREFGGRLEAIEPALHDLLDDTGFPAWRQQSPNLHDYDVVLVNAPEERSSEVSGSADLIVRRLAELVAELHARHEFSAVVVTGGDGARALVNQWGCTGIAVHSSVSEGMPRGFLVGGEVDGLPIVTKAGGFGPPEALVLAVLAVRSSQARDDVTQQRTR